MNVTITQLLAELVSLVSKVPAFTHNNFSIFDLDDLIKTSEMQSFPIVGVGYDGAEPTDTLNPVSKSNVGAVLIDTQFIVVVGVDYVYGSGDKKSQATDLLSQVRPMVAGYQKVNSRPWRFIGERPEPQASGNGIIFYSQIWRTLVPLLANPV